MAQLLGRNAGRDVFYARRAVELRAPGATLSVRAFDIAYNFDVTERVGRPARYRRTAEVGVTIIGDRHSLAFAHDVYGINNLDPTAPTATLRTDLHGTVYEYEFLPRHFAFEDDTGEMALNLRGEIYRVLEAPV